MWNAVPLLLPSLFIYLLNGPVQNFSFYGVLPDLALISLVFYGNGRSRTIGIFAGLLAGLTIDALSAAPIGFFTIIYVTVGYLSALTRGKVYVDPVFTPLLMVGAGFLIKGLLVFLISGAFGYPEVQSHTFNEYYLIQLLFTLFLGPVFFALFNFLDKTLPKKRKGGYQD